MCFNNFDFIPFTEKEKNEVQSISLASDTKLSVIPNKILTKISYDAFSKLSFSFTKEHIENIIKAFLSENSSENDKYVCASILKNALVAAEGKYPICQDTGIANVFAWKNSLFLTTSQQNKTENDCITDGIRKLYDEKKLRFSTTCPKDFYTEYDPQNNMPPQISIFNGNSCLAPIPEFVKTLPQNSMAMICCAKGGGSSNKTTFIQGTKATLNKDSLITLLKEQIKKLGTAACPPYTIAIVVGGLSPEQNLLTLKLATCGAYNNMTYTPNDLGFRDKDLEEQVIKIASETGYGAQFGGSQFALEAFVIRLSRHGASCPISIGVSCSAHRNLKVIITNEGYYLEKTVSDLYSIQNFDKAISFLENDESNNSKKITSDNNIENTLEQLRGLKPGDRILISGKILVARDAAHARWKKLLDEGKQLPEYTQKYPICYAGPARTPEGKIIGSFGPTTAGRMDSYADILMSRGAALVTLAKGNRNKQWQEACKKYKGFYLGTPGGIAALIASKYITSQEIIDYEDLGMEAVRLITVNQLPSFVLTNDNGDDFYNGTI